MEVEAGAAAVAVERPGGEAWAGLVVAHRAAAVEEVVASPRRDIRKIWRDLPAAERDRRDRAARDRKA